MDDPVVDRVKFHYNPYRQAVECFIVGNTVEMNPRKVVANPIQFTIREGRDASREVSPAFVVSDRNIGCIQELFNDLWCMGYRPVRDLEQIQIKLCRLILTICGN